MALLWKYTAQAEFLTLENGWVIGCEDQGPNNYDLTGDAVVTPKVATQDAQYGGRDVFTWSTLYQTANSLSYTYASALAQPVTYVICGHSTASNEVSEWLLALVTPPTPIHVCTLGLNELGCYSSNEIYDDITNVGRDPAVWFYVFDGAASGIWRNNNRVATLTGDLGTGTTPNFHIAGTIGKCAEFRAYSTALTWTERDGVYREIGLRYGLVTARAGGPAMAWPREA
jgi:hypothetical protein